MKLLLAATFIAAGLVPALSLSASAHNEWDWMRQQDARNPGTGVPCCGPDDCFRISASDVDEQGDFYRIRFRGHILSYPVAQTMPPADGKSWLCVDMQTLTPRCLFLYLGG